MACGRLGPVPHFTAADIAQCHTAATAKKLYTRGRKYPPLRHILTGFWNKFHQNFEAVQHLSKSLGVEEMSFLSKYGVWNISRAVGYRLRILTGTLI